MQILDLTRELYNEGVAVGHTGFAGNLFPQVTRGSTWVGPGKLLGNGKVKVPGVGHVAEAVVGPASHLHLSGSGRVDGGA